MNKLNLESLGARTLMTVFATGTWLVIVCCRKGHFLHATWIGVSTLVIIIPSFAVLAPQLDRWLPNPSEANPQPPRRKLATGIEFALYSAFIALVTYQSVELGKIQAFWYGIPASLTIGIIPQITSLWNRFYSILLSVSIYAVVLWYSASLNYFLDKDIVFRYAVVAAAAFSVLAAEILLYGVCRMATLVSKCVTAVLRLVTKLSNLVESILKAILDGINKITKKK